MLNFLEWTIRLRNQYSNWRFIQFRNGFIYFTSVDHNYKLDTTWKRYDQVLIIRFMYGKFTLLFRPWNIDMTYIITFWPLTLWINNTDCVRVKCKWAIDNELVEIQRLIDGLQIRVCVRKTFQGRWFKPIYKIKNILHVLNS